MTKTSHTLLGPNKLCHPEMSRPVTDTEDYKIYEQIKTQGKLLNVAMISDETRYAEKSF